MGCNQRNIVANIQLAATCKVGHDGRPKDGIQPVQRLQSIKPANYTCQSCKNTFSNWKEAKQHFNS